MRIAHLQAFVGLLEPPRRRTDGRPQGKLSGKRLNGVQSMKGQIALQFGSATADLRARRFTASITSGSWAKSTWAVSPNSGS